MKLQGDGEKMARTGVFACFVVFRGNGSVAWIRLRVAWGKKEIGRLVGRRRKFSRPGECNDPVSFRNGISTAATHVHLRNVARQMCSGI